MGVQKDAAFEKDSPTNAGSFGVAVRESNKNGLVICGKLHCRFGRSDRGYLASMNIVQKRRSLVSPFASQQGMIRDFIAFNYKTFLLTGLASCIDRGRILCSKPKASLSDCPVKFSVVKQIFAIKLVRETSTIAGAAATVPVH